MRPLLGGAVSIVLSSFDGELGLPAHPQGGQHESGGTVLWANPGPSLPDPHLPPNVQIFVEIYKLPNPV